MLRCSSLLRREHGFTLIELLVVILIIALLAVVALPQFARERGKSQDARAKSDVRNAVTYIEACHARTEDYRNCTDGGELSRETGLVAGVDTGEIDLRAFSTKTYRIASKSFGGNTFIARRENTGAMVFTCSIPEGNPRSGCQRNGGW